MERKDWTSSEYFDSKWSEVIPHMPNGGVYRFNLRRHGYNIIRDYIKKDSIVFDFACGLSVMDDILVKEKGCVCFGCDISKVAVQYSHKNINMRVKQTDQIFGDGYDYILALYFLEHIPDPVQWLKESFKRGKEIICMVPNNFNRRDEHKLMQWGNWKEFYELFKDFETERIDIDKYPKDLKEAFRHPIVTFKLKS